MQVVSVIQGGTTYESGTDFQLSNDGIDWSLPGVEPSIGTTYTAVYRYNKIMEVGTDVELITSDGRNSVKFINPSSLPVNQTSFYVDYTFYLARTDLICLDKEGAVSIVKGRADLPRLVKPPINGDSSLLVLGYIYIAPMSPEVEIYNYNTTRLSQADLFNLSRRLNDIEYNQAITDLDAEAMAGESATSLKGIFTDGFIGVSKCDLGHDDFDCTINIEDGTLSFLS